MAKPPKPPTHYPMVQIVWRDAVSTGAEWLTHKQFMKSCKIADAYTCGYLIEDTEDTYLVAQSYFPHDKVKSQGTAIPKAWVKSFHIVEDVPVKGDPHGEVTETT